YIQRALGRPPAETAEPTRESEVVSAREVIHRADPERAQVTAALEPELPKESVERLELGVRLDFEIKPICRQARGRCSNLHQPLLGAIRRVVTGCTADEVFLRAGSCHRLSAQRARAALTSVLLQDTGHIDCGRRPRRLFAPDDRDGR